MGVLSIITRVYHALRIMGIIQDSKECQCDKCKEQRRNTCSKDVSRGTSLIVVLLIVGVVVIGLLLLTVLYYAQLGR